MGQFKPRHDILKKIMISNEIDKFLEHYLLFLALHMTVTHDSLLHLTRFAWNSKATASEFLENIEEMTSILVFCS